MRLDLLITPCLNNLSTGTGFTGGGQGRKHKEGGYFRTRCEKHTLVAIVGEDFGAETHRSELLLEGPCEKQERRKVPQPLRQPGVYK